MLKQWLRWLWENESGFFGIGQGPNPAEYQLESALARAGNFATGEGEADILASDKLWQAILSGDPGQISKVLGPQMSAINKQGQQNKLTASQFGNRGGGTNAGSQMTDDTTRSAIDSTISQLTGTAATSLGSGGRGLLGTGVSAETSAFGAASTIQQQNASKWNDIFKSTADSAAPFTGGTSLGMGSFSEPGSGSGGGSWDDDEPITGGGGNTGVFSGDVVYG